MNPEILSAIADHPKNYRDHLLIETDSGVRRLTDCLDPWQCADFEALDSGWRRVAGHKSPGGLQRAYLERPRGHSKTSDLAAMTTWALIASPRRVSGIVSAADKDQAKLLTDATERLVSANHWLAKFLAVSSYKVENRHTGSELQILSNDVASSWGHLPDFVIADEICNWGERRDLWDSLFSAAAKKTDCMLIIGSNAGNSAGVSWQWDLRENCRADESWYFSSLPGPVASWLSPKLLAEQKRLLPDFIYSQVWDNKWGAPGGLRIKKEWLRTYTTNGDYYRLHGADGQQEQIIHLQDCLRIMVLDPAGSSADVAEQSRSRRHSWSAIGTFDLGPCGEIMVADMIRLQAEVPDVVNRTEVAYAVNKPQWVGCENTGIGLAVYQVLTTRPGLSVRPLEPGGKDKATRFTKAQVALEQGRVYLPAEAEWLAAFKNELLTWTGSQKDTFDQGDTLGYAGIEAAGREGGPVTIPVGGFSFRRRL